MTESGGAEDLDLTMLVVGYEISYVRDPRPSGSGVSVNMSVKGAKVEHHENRPISRVILLFSEGPFPSDSVGTLDTGDFQDISIFATLPRADFTGFWAALRLDRAARLECVIRRGTPDKVLILQLKSQGSLFPVFPALPL